MKEITTSVYGQLSCPESFDELLLLISENKKSSHWNVSYWRGQSNIDWKIDSGAVRRLRRKENTYPKPDNIEEKDICFYEKDLIQRARKNMFDFDIHGRRMSDFEVLITLQHNGAATRLLDFSKSALIGLFFCTNDQEYQNEYGLLFGIDTHIIGGHEDEFDFSFNYDAFINHTKSNEEDVLCISPPPISNRIAAQHAVLLCSKYVDGEYGSLYIDDRSQYYKYIAISPELKKMSNSFLKNYFDITRATMFPDLSGFCDINSTKWGTAENTRW